jgi:membrane-associated protease RseP (regulator of RpoE activity)
MQPEQQKPNPQPAPQRASPAPAPQRSTGVPGAAPARSRTMTLVYGAVVVAALAFGAVATGLVHVPGFDSGAGAPATSATQQADVQQIDEGDHTVGGRFSSLTPESAKERQLGRTSGVFVVEAFGNSPLEKAGVRTNDIVVAVDGVPVRLWTELAVKIGLTPIGQQLTVTLDRAGVTENHSITIARCLVREPPKTPGYTPACMSWTQ